MPAANEKVRNRLQCPGWAASQAGLLLMGWCIFSGMFPREVLKTTGCLGGVHEHAAEWMPSKAWYVCPTWQAVIITVGATNSMRWQIDITCRCFNPAATSKVLDASTGGGILHSMISNCLVTPVLA